MRPDITETFRAVAVIADEAPSGGWDRRHGPFL
jgi:hypothetical protein